ncbi:MAG: hypothetical protein KBB77_02340 [Candidatus Moranbacteria bacterium]|nr:hypothetical protein [Candidatus Moranbacteria bacterium]
MSFETLLTFLGILIAWIAFRYGTYQERKRLLITVQSTLTYSSQWFDTQYPEKYNNKDWLNPDFRVNEVNVDLLSSVASSGHTISEDFSKYLALYIQLIAVFNQRIRECSALIFSDSKAYYEQIQNIDDKNMRPSIIDNQFTQIILDDNGKSSFFSRLYHYQKSIHNAIGIDADYTNNIPQLYKCHQKLKRIVACETNKSYIESSPAILFYFDSAVCGIFIGVILFFLI